MTFVTLSGSGYMPSLMELLNIDVSVGARKAVRSRIIAGVIL